MFHELLCAWRQAAALLKARQITQEEYDRWRYPYPEFDPSGKWQRPRMDAAICW